MFPGAGCAPGAEQSSLRLGQSDEVSVLKGHGFSRAVKDCK